MDALAFCAVGIDVAAMALCATGVEAVGMALVGIVEVQASALALGAIVDTSLAFFATAGWMFGVAGMLWCVSVTS